VPYAQAHVIKFTRELAQLPDFSDEARQLMCSYIEQVS
jgi:hypothetical protein